MTALDVIATCAERGIQLIPEGDSLRVRGPRKVRDELLPEIAKHKPEIVRVLKSPALPGTTGTTVTTSPVTTAPTRQPLPPDGPREPWAYDWLGRPVNPFGLRPGDDGRSPIFVLPKPKGLQ